MLDLEWPLQTASKKTVILLHDEVPSDTVTGTYGPSGTEYGAAWARDGRCISRDDESLTLENVPLKKRIKWLILCNSAYPEHGDNPAGSERIVYDGRFYDTKQRAEDQIKRWRDENRTAPRPQSDEDACKADLRVVCVELNEP